MPVAFVGVVCWLTPWLAGLEAQFFDRFVYARPVRHPSVRVLVTLWDDPTRSLSRGSAESYGGEDPAVALASAVRALHRAGVRAIVLSGKASVWMADSLAHAKDVDARGSAVAELTETPVENALFGPSGQSSSMVLWWDVSRSRGDPVYLRDVRKAGAVHGTGQQAEADQAARGANAPKARRAIQVDTSVTIAALRPLPKVPLWSGESLLATNWYGPANTFPHVSVEQVVSGSLPPETLRDAVVVFGQRGDDRPTPMGVMSHAEVHANLVATMLENRWLRPLPAWWHWMIMFVVGVLAATAVTRTYTVTAIVALLFEAAAVGMVARAALNYDYWFCCTPALATGALSAVGALAVSLEVTRAARSRLARDMELRDELLAAVSQDLRESERRFREMADLLPDMIYETDANFRMVYANRTALTSLGYSAADVQTGIHLSDILPREDLARAQESLEAAAASGHTTVGVYTVRARNGSLVPCEIHSVAVMSPEGKLLGYRGVLRDISERRQVETAQRMAALGELAAGVAHEFNNILSAMLLRAQVAKRRGSREAHEELVEVVSAGAAHGAQVCENLSRFARPREPQLKPAMIETPIEAALSMAAHELENAQITVQRSYGSEGHAVYCDARQLEQVFLNLIINACHAMASGGTLAVETEYDADAGGTGEVVARVSDTGVGISRGDLPHIFEPFFTTKSRGADEKGGGTGLGLSVSHGIVSAHGGKLGVQSRMGVGTTFELRLAACEAATELLEPLEVGGDPLRYERRIGLRALIAEDEAPIREALASLLSDEGYEVVTARDADEALGHLASADFDVVISDLVMPGGGGARVLAAVRQLPDRPAVMLVTGMLKADIAQQLSELGADAFLQKPFDAEDVLGALDKVVAERARLSR